MKRSELIKLLAATAELCGANFSPEAAQIFVGDLEGVPVEQLAGALKRCRMEVRGRLTVADVMARLQDGRPGPEEAWSMLPLDEGQTVVWTEEMRKAWAIAYPLMRAGERVPARMAFKEAYVAEVARARDARFPPMWAATFGTDPHGRVAPLVEAVRVGRLPRAAAVALLPDGTDIDTGLPIAALPNPKRDEAVRAAVAATRRAAPAASPPAAPQIDAATTGPT